MLTRVLRTVHSGVWSAGDNFLPVSPDGSAPGHTLLLVTTGARSGLRRETPLFFVRDGQRLVLTASKGGADRREEYRVR
jgi:hypothetical protein